MINGIQWSDNLYVLVGIVVAGTIIAVAAMKLFFNDWSDSI